MNNSKKIAVGAAAIAAVVAAGVFFAVIKPANDRKIAEAKETERRAAYEACEKAQSDSLWAEGSWIAAYNDSSWASSIVDKLSDRKLADEFNKIRYSYIGPRDYSIRSWAERNGITPTLEEPKIDCKTDDSTETLKSNQAQFEDFTQKLKENTSVLKEKNDEVRAAQAT